MIQAGYMSKDPKVKTEDCTAVGGPLEIFVEEFNGSVWETTRSNIVKSVRTTMANNSFSTKLNKMKDLLTERREILRTQYSGIIQFNDQNISEFGETNRKLIEENYDEVKIVMDTFLGSLEAGVSP